MNRALRFLDSVALEQSPPTPPVHPVHKTTLQSPPGPPLPPGPVHTLPPTIWALGVGSLFMDTSSELIHSILPVFMSSVLGAGMGTIGLIEGIAESAAAASKVFSGILSDRLGRRKLLVVSGYGLSALTKPIFPLTSSLWWIFAGRALDRLGKGLRGAPRDALIADITLPNVRGAAYGLRQSLDSVGAFLGPILALAFMAWTDNDIRAVLWIGVVPALVAVTIFVLAISEPDRPRDATAVRRLFLASSIGRLGRSFWLITLLAGVFSLARFSEAFLILRALTVGLSAGLAPAIMVLMNVVYALTAYPAGAVADRVRRRTLLVIGLWVLVSADVILALAQQPWHVLAGTGLWGLQMGLTQGVFSKMVSEAVPEEMRGTAFGVFNLVAAAALLAASIAAGALWESIGPGATFWVGAAFSAAAATGVVWFTVRFRKA